MADQSSEDWLPTGWTVSVRVRRNGKKDKHYFAPSGLKFYSKVEVTRYLKTVHCSPPEPKQEKGAIFLESTKDASADAVEKECPNSEEKGKFGLELPSLNGSPESEDKYYSAEEIVDDNCGDAAQSGSLNSQDKENAKPEQPAEHCSDPKSGEVKALAIEEFAHNVCGSSMEVAKSNIEQFKESSSAPQSKEVKSINAEESTGRICGNAAENLSQQSKEENVILEESRKNACDHVEQGCSPSSKEKKKTRTKQSASVLDESGAAEGLPDGWIKEVKVRKKNNVVRKDAYYIDPSSGYIFRSMKDALRYLATGNIGRLAFKRKGRDDIDTDLEDDKNFSTSETKRQKQDKNGTSSEDQRLKQTEQHSSDENKTATKDWSSGQSAEVRNERVVEPPDIGKGMQDAEYYFDQGVSVSDLSGSDLPKRRISGKNEKRNSSTETDSISANEAVFTRDQHPIRKTEEMPVLADKAAVLTDELPSDNRKDTPASAEVAGVPRDEQPQENTEKTRASADDTGGPRAEQLLEKTEAIAALTDEAGLLQDEHSSQKTEKTPRDRTPQVTPKSQKKVLDLPRRTSNRLAGAAADPGLEVTRTRAQRGVVRKLDEGEPTVRKSVTTRDCSQLQSQPKRTRRASKLLEPLASVGPSEAALEDDANKLRRDQGDGKKKGENTPAIPQENIISSNRAEKLKASNESEEENLLPFELPSGDILSDPCIEFAIKTLTGIDFYTSNNTSRSSNDSNSSRDVASLEVQAEHMETERKVDKKQAPLDKSISMAYNYEEKAEAEIPSSSLSDLPFGDSWQDPCIEFAIKTLTGAIPVECDLDIDDLMRQQMRSTQMQESSEVALSNAGVNFCPTDLLWQHSIDVSSDRTAYRQQGGVVPITQQPGNNVDLQRTGGAVVRQHHQNRGNRYQR